MPGDIGNTGDNCREPSIGRQLSRTLERAVNAAERYAAMRGLPPVRDGGRVFRCEGELPAAYDPAERSVELLAEWHPGRRRTAGDGGGAGAVVVLSVMLCGKEICDELPEWVLDVLTRQAWTPGRPAAARRGAADETAQEEQDEGKGF